MGLGVVLAMGPKGGFRLVVKAPFGLDQEGQDGFAIDENGSLPSPIDVTGGTRRAPDARPILKPSANNNTEVEGQS